MTDALDKTFDLPPEVESMEQSIKEIDIPENPELKDIAAIALDAYKDMMATMRNMDPKYRNRLLEVAQSYLETAKDAIARAEDLKQKREKLDSTLKKATDDSSAGGKTPRLSVVSDIDTRLRKEKANRKSS